MITITFMNIQWEETTNGNKQFYGKQWCAPQEEILKSFLQWDNDLISNITITQSFEKDIPQAVMKRLEGQK